MITKIADDGTLAFDFIGQLLPYQQTGVEFMLRIDQEYGTVFNFDDMGMGKQFKLWLICADQANIQH